MHRVLVAVADSPASLAAVREAVALAARLPAELRALHVVSDGVLADLLGALDGTPGLPARRDAASSSLLRHVAEIAARAGVPAATVQEEGDVARSILRHAHEWPADIVVIGRTSRRGPGEPFLSGATQRVLEFTDRPVLVVPARCAPLT